MKAQRICTTFLLLNLVLMVNGDDKDSVDTTGYCSVYNGKICKAHISSRQVWFSSADGSGGWLNEQTTVNLFEEMISELPEICRAAAEVNTPIYLYDHSNSLITVLFQKLLCAFAFPHCLLNNEGLTLKLPLCYEGESMRKRWSRFNCSNSHPPSRLCGHSPPVLLQRLGAHRGEETERTSFQVSRNFPASQLHRPAAIHSETKDVLLRWTHRTGRIESHS